MKTKHYSTSSLVRSVVGILADLPLYPLLLAGFLLLPALPSAAGTVAYWRFEEGPADANVSHGGQADGVFYPGTADSSGNGNALSVWAEGWAGYAYRADVPASTVSQTGAANNFSVQNTGSYPAMFTQTGSPMQTMTPNAFTIEVSFKSTGTGWRTLVGRDSIGTVLYDQDGNPGDPNLSALYLQITPDNAVAIKFCDVAGVWHQAISAPGIIANSTWYHLAAVSDYYNGLLSLYFDSGSGYALVAQAYLWNITPDPTLTAGTGSGSDWVAGTWTVGRGLYAGTHSDRAYGYIDEVRISDSALSTNQFLFFLRPPPIVMTNSDALGYSSFNSAGTWTNHAAPAAGNDYSTAGYTLRGPASGAGPYIFAGDSLTVGEGAFSPVTGNGNALLFKVNGQTLTVNNLILNGGQIRDGLADGNNTYLTGNISVGANGGAFMAQDTNWIFSAISGSSTIYIGDNGYSGATRQIIFASAANTFTGDIMMTNTHGSVSYSRLILAPGSLWNFAIGANGVNNRIFGQGTLQLNGVLNFNLTGAGSTHGDSWSIVDQVHSSVTYGSSFAVNGFTQNGKSWYTLANGVIYEFNMTNGVLSVWQSPPIVTNIADSGLGTLRYAVAGVTNGSTITFASELSGANILLTDGQIDLNHNLTVDASALPGGITINGNNASRIFQVNGGVTVVLNSLTITSGSAYSGGGVNNDGNLTVNNCTFSGNTATSGDGGGINSSGTLALNQCTFFANAAARWGGGIEINYSTLTVNQSTISGNSCAAGGGPGGIDQYGGTLSLINSIVAGNTSPNSDPNIYGSFTGMNNLTAGDPQLAPLGNSGGPTPTMPPLAGSPAIDAGNDSVTNTFAADQRGPGFTRFFGLHVDIGAVESTFAPTAPTVVTQPATGQTLTTATLNATITPNGAVTTCYFEYGTTTAYGANTTDNTLSAGTAAVNANLTALSPGTTYHFRAVATNSLGTTFGDDLTFHTSTLAMVTSANDSGPGSLREIVANSVSGDGIAFDASLSGATILLTSGQITLNQDLTIDGSVLANGITIDGQASGRIFEVAASSIVVLDSLTLAHGQATATDLGDVTAFVGGGILNWGTLTVNRCTLTGNVATNFGGGGAIWNEFGTVTVNQSTLTGNNADYSLGGGAIVNSSGIMTVNQSTLTGNSAVSSTYNGGGILNAGSLTLNNSIVAGNTASVNPDLVSLGETITATGVNLTNGAPLLAPLNNYGGPTPTMPPLPGSPALDACTDGTSFATDQRGAGFPRIAGAYADIGAVEAGNPIPGFMVNTAADENDGVGVNGISLRDALGFWPSGSTITFAPELSGATIVLTNGQLNVPSSVSIVGPGAGILTVSGNNASRVFNVTGTNVTISGLTIADGQSSLNGAGIYSGTGPGSVLSINGCVITNNSTSSGGCGGGIYNSPGVTMTISNCTISGNSASSANGGGIYTSNATLTINASTVSDNWALLVGGGVMNISQSGSAALTISASTVSSNSAIGGGGIVNYCDSGSARLTINASTFSGNVGYNGGDGIYNTFGTLEIGDTILNAGAAGGNIYNYFGTVTSDGYNLCSDAAGGDGTAGPGGFLNASGDMRNTNPLLGPLQDNGGPTWTHALLPGSPAIDKGNGNAVPGLGLATDQRGLPRTVDFTGIPNATGGDGSDIGAFEAQITLGCGPMSLTDSTKCGDGSFLFCFTNTPCASFTVFTTTNLALPFSNWDVLGVPVEIAPGQFRFTDAQATNSPQRYYRVTSP